MGPAEVDKKLREALNHRADIEADIRSHFANIEELHLDANAVADVIDSLLDVRLLTP